MDGKRFDQVAKMFADRRLSRRQAVINGGVGLAIGAVATTGLTATARAQEATPAATSEKATSMLFVQTYGSGSVAAVEGSDSRYTLTLEQGYGQTVYFSDRPERLVGASPTDQFLDGLGFPENNPPNAALVVETAPGETDIAVVELYSPVYNPDSKAVTYEIAVLSNWQTSLAMEFTEAPTNLAALVPSFGTANLFIDDCADRGIICHAGDTGVGEFESQGFCYWWSYAGCYPCENGGASNRDEIATYWENKCNETYSDCEGNCTIAYAGPLICTDPRGCN